MKASRVTLFVFFALFFLVLSCTGTPTPKVIIPSVNFELGKNDFIKDVLANITYDPYSDEIFIPKDEGILMKSYYKYIKSAVTLDPEYYSANGSKYGKEPLVGYYKIGNDVVPQRGGFTPGIFFDPGVFAYDIKKCITIVDGLPYFSSFMYLSLIQKYKTNQPNAETTYDKINEQLRDTSSHKYGESDIIRLYKYGWSIIRTGPVTPIDAFQNYKVPIGIAVLYFDSVPYRGGSILADWPGEKVYIIKTEILLKKDGSIQNNVDKSVIDKLSELKSLLDKGLINQDEYDAKKKEILSKM